VTEIVYNIGRLLNSRLPRVTVPGDSHKVNSLLTVELGESVTIVASAVAAYIYNLQGY
jgi:hypothetical protein